MNREDFKGLSTLYEIYLNTSEKDRAKRQIYAGLYRMFGGKKKVEEVDIRISAFIMVLYRMFEKMDYYDNKIGKINKDYRLAVMQDKDTHEVIMSFIKEYYELVSTFITGDDLMSVMFNTFNQYYDCCCWMEYFEKVEKPFIIDENKRLLAPEYKILNMVEKQSGSVGRLPILNLHFDLFSMDIYYYVGSVHQYLTKRSIGGNKYKLSNLNKFIGTVILIFRLLKEKGIYLKNAMWPENKLHIE